jgi:hypothetical protein
MATEGSRTIISGPTRVTWPYLMFVPSCAVVSTDQRRDDPQIARLCRRAAHLPTVVNHAG